MIYGYARVSTMGQNLGSQISQLKKENCNKIYYEKFTGTTVNRPKFEELLNKLKKGDTLIVTKLDRFARNTKEALEVIQYLFDKGVKIHILNMGIIENSPTGNLMFTILSAFAQFERDLIVTRTQEGKEIAKKTNPHFHEGRNFTYSDDDIRHAYSLVSQGESVAEISEKTGISEPTLYRRFKVMKLWHENS